MSCRRAAACRIWRSSVAQTVKGPELVEELEWQARHVLRRGPRRTGISARGRRPPGETCALPSSPPTDDLGVAVRQVQDDPLADAHEGYGDLLDPGKAGQSLVDDGRRKDDVGPVLPQAQLARRARGS